MNRRHAALTPELTPERVGLKLAALCLQYPGPRFRALLPALQAEVAGLPAEVRRELTTFCAAVRSLDPTEWESRYVSAFDFAQEQALYLTYHEEGEQLRRASAMVELKRQIRESGFRCPANELPDYIPLLLEYLAERPATADELPERLARALSAIATSLAASDPLYLPVLRAALAVLPEAGSAVARASGCGAAPTCTGCRTQSAIETGVIP